MSSTSSTTSGRRIPPPPPPPIRNSSITSRTTTLSRTSPPSTSASASDRSSILSTATTGTSYTSGSSHTPTINNAVVGGLNPSLNKLVRQPPIPASARHRYEKVFYANVDARKKANLDKSQAQIPGLLGVPGVRTSSPTSIKKARKAAGWRGLSVDLITNPDENLPSLPPSQPESRRGSIESAESGGVIERGKDERLEGMVIRRIWMCSTLDREKLRAIWNGCEGSETGSLDVDAFVKAMWQIDEELRKARLNPSSFGPNYGQGSPSRRQPRRIGSILR
ncbi:hypothetical protein BDM02DRAFT_3091248 [Thelephora ganbajun]|uniref:Uncharacterized protein n=1 Tax=Thelephora ganbajun TaxID=370292 RepID=A0ACB6ZPK9_THEGA|nr:hypothetical protein BDM02DRAFT_3091248 [Thelephora ganbajun]